MVAQVWSGHAAQRARTYMTRYLPGPCGQCGLMVNVTDEWVVGHTKSRATHPELTMQPNNWRIEHKACSDASGTSVFVEKIKRDALRSVGVDLSSGFSGSDVAPTPRHFPISLSVEASTPLEVPERLIWDHDSLSAYPWLSDLLQVPEDASVPLAMTPPHPDAIGSYGAEAIEWIEKVERKTLRWWQKLAITRQLEHDSEGRLVWRTVVESASRRSGKSVRVRGVAMWRLVFGPELFGERQEVVHTGSDLAVCRKAQKEAWRWSRANGLKVTQGNGKEAIESENGDTWLVRAQDATYGWDTTLALVDEGWDVKPETVSEGLEPSLMERQSPQLHLTSTAHRLATSLMKRRISAALSDDDGETLLMLWAAPAGADPGDPETWRKLR